MPVLRGIVNGAEFALLYTVYLLALGKRLSVGSQTTLLLAPGRGNQQGRTAPVFHSHVPQRPCSKRGIQLLAERLIAIGDIHGCRVALDTLLDEVAPGPDDIVVTLGDYVDRGPDSRGVIDRLIELGKQTRLIGLLGNHEEMMLRVIREGEPHHAWLRYGAVQTLESYSFDGDLGFLPPDHNAFFDSLGDYFEVDDYFFTHAAYSPDLPLPNQSTELLRWYPLTEGLPSPHISGKTAIVGHTANRDGEILDAGHLICIDTYCYGGGWLTALDVFSRQIWQASQEGALRQTRETRS